MSYTAVAKMKRLRGAVLELLCTNHDQQQSRLDATALWSALVRGLGFEASQNEIATVLQDLEDRAYVKFNQRKDKKTGYVYITQIQLCPRARDLLEGTIEDSAVELS